MTDNGLTGPPVLKWPDWFSGSDNGLNRSLVGVNNLTGPLVTDNGLTGPPVFGYRLTGPPVTSIGQTGLSKCQWSELSSGD